MTKVSVAQAKAHLSRLLAKVESGHEVLITRRGTSVARLAGIERAKRPLKLESIDAFRDKLSPTRDRSVNLVRRMRDASY